MLSCSSMITLELFAAFMYGVGGGNSAAIPKYLSMYEYGSLDQHLFTTIGGPTHSLEDLVAGYSMYKRPGLLSIDHIWARRPSWPEQCYQNATALPSCPVGGLVPGWDKALSKQLALASNYFKNGTLKGVFLGDELVSHGVPVSAQRAAAELVKRTLGDSAFVYANENARAFDPQYHFNGSYVYNGGIPDALDIVSIDAYCFRSKNSSTVCGQTLADQHNLHDYRNGATEPVVVRRFYKEFIYPLLRPHQAVAVVPGLFGDGTVPVAAQEPFLNAKLDGYWDWATQDSLVVMLNPYHWASYCANCGCTACKCDRTPPSSVNAKLPHGKPTFAGPHNFCVLPNVSSSLQYRFTRGVNEFKTTLAKLREIARVIRDARSKKNGADQ